MFTLIRIMLHRPSDDARRRVAPTPIIDDQAEDDSTELPKGNPWKQELERLEAASDRPQLRRFAQVPVAGAAPPAPAAGIKQGTLTDLRAWWGKAITPQTPNSSSARNRQYPPKKINRWQQ